MTQFRNIVLSRTAILAVGAIAFVIGISSCQIPVDMNPVSSTEPSLAITQMPPTGISPEIHTQVAATIYAPLQATWTFQATTSEGALEPTFPPSPSDLPPANPQISEQPPDSPTPANLQPSATTTAIQESISPFTSTPFQIGPTPSPQPNTYTPSNPAGSFVTQPGNSIRIAGVNLPSCGQLFVANFLILNKSGHPIESASLALIDLTSALDLTHSTMNNHPFMYDDRTCSPGGHSHLNSGYALFTGAAVDAVKLSGHLLQANFLFCTGNNLTGNCVSRTVEFVVP